MARCNFCAFYRPVGSSAGYVLGFDEIFRKIDETIAVGGNQLLLQGGHNPDLPLPWYEDLFRSVKARYPEFKLHALSPPEVIHISRLSQLPVATVIERLVAAGLDSIPGGGAEILVDRVRTLLHCVGKATADEWLGVMREAHRAGLRTTATMMYGTVETLDERLEHMFRLRDLQDETGGFTAFITWSFQPDHTELGEKHGVTTEATGIEYLRTLAIARLVLDNFDNLQASWVTQGGKVGQLSLAFGANDMGTVMIEENVVRAAGAAYCMDEVEIVRNIEDAGFIAKRRNMHYEVLGDPIFRERQVPRMLHLATARADGDTSVPEELTNYAARSKPGKAARGQRLIAASITRTVPRAGSSLRWILPIADGPLLNGWIALDRGRVAAVGRASASLPFRDDAPLVDLGEMAVMPALVNAHTHLELSWMAGRVPAARALHRLGARDARPPASATPPPDEIAASIDAAIAQARASGTGLVGDISNSLATVDPLRRSDLRGVVFHELLRLRARDADDVLEQGLLALERAGASERMSVSLAPHAPYSVSPQLFQGIRAALARMPFLPTSVHLGESPEEVELLATGQGPWRQLLEDLGAWDPAWQPPGCGPVEYLDRMKLLGPRTLAVHGVQFGVDELARLAATGATLVTCPRSNEYVGVGAPPVERFYRAGVRVAIGTDSLASVDDLNLFAELAALRALGPAVPAGVAAGQRHGPRRPRAGVRGRFRHDRAGAQSVAHRDRPAAVRVGCGRISGRRHRAARRALGGGLARRSREVRALDSVLQCCGAARLPGPCTDASEAP